MFILWILATVLNFVGKSYKLADFPTGLGAVPAAIPLGRGVYMGLRMCGKG